MNDKRAKVMTDDDLGKIFDGISKPDIYDTIVGSVMKLNHAKKLLKFNHQEIILYGYTGQALSNYHRIQKIIQTEMDYLGQLVSLAGIPKKVTDRE